MDIIKKTSLLILAVFVIMALTMTSGMAFWLLIGIGVITAGLYYYGLGGLGRRVYRWFSGE